MRRKYPNRKKSNKKKTQEKCKKMIFLMTKCEERKKGKKDVYVGRCNCNLIFTSNLYLFGNWTVIHFKLTVNKLGFILIFF